MPLYVFHNKLTDEVYDDFMSISSMELFVKENPHIKQVISAPNIISGISGVTHKTDGGFKDLMGRIAAANPTTPLADQYGDKSVKSTKTREAVKKQRQRQLLSK